MVSKTDKTKPNWVAVKDPYNRRFMIVTSVDRFSYPYWKKLTSCHDSNCCYGYWKKNEKAKRRHGWKRELRREGND